MQTKLPFGKLPLLVIALIAINQAVAAPPQRVRRVLPLQTNSITALVPVLQGIEERINGVMQEFVPLIANTNFPSWGVSNAASHLLSIANQELGLRSVLRKQLDHMIAERRDEVIDSQAKAGEPALSKNVRALHSEIAVRLQGELIELRNIRSAVIRSEMLINSLGNDLVSEATAMGEMRESFVLIEEPKRSELIEDSNARISTYLIGSLAALKRARSEVAHLKKAVESSIARSP